MNKNTVILLSKAKQSHNCLLNNNFKFYISQFFKTLNFLSVSILLHNLVKIFLTSIKFIFTFDNLSRKIKNPCLVINTNFLFYLGIYCEIKKNYLLSLILEFDFKIFLEYTIMYNYSKYL